MQRKTTKTPTLVLLSTLILSLCVPNFVTAVTYHQVLRFKGTLKGTCESSDNPLLGISGSTRITLSDSIFVEIFGNPRDSVVNVGGDLLDQTSEILLFFTTDGLIPYLDDTFLEGRAYASRPPNKAGRTRGSFAASGPLVSGGADGNLRASVSLEGTFGAIAPGRVSNVSANFIISNVNIETPSGNFSGCNLKGKLTIGPRDELFFTTF